MKWYVIAGRYSNQKDSTIWTGGPYKDSAEASEAFEAFMGRKFPEEHADELLEFSVTHIFESDTPIEDLDGLALDDEHTWVVRNNEDGNDYFEVQATDALTAADLALEQLGYTLAKAPEEAE